MPLYPGTGAIGERGEYDTIVNAPLPEHAGSKLFREAMETKILPRVDAFAPDLIVISAGFDAPRFDPIGGLLLEVADFSWITNKFMEIAERRARGRIVSTLRARRPDAFKPILLGRTGPTCSHDEIQKTSAGVELARIMQDLVVEISCGH
jgi:hypothetical protein